MKKDQQQNNNRLDQQIREIESKIQKDSMSVLIGAGFSKNACKDFPSWAELLADLVVELYPKIKQKQKQRIEEKIKEAGGYVEFVDKYIKVKRHREAIDLYISKKLKAVLSKNLNLGIHKQLLNIDWKDIFTTNYDTLLEKANEERYAKYTVVTHKHDLRSANKRRIIKLHGSYTDGIDKQGRYGFDDDKYSHYIISSKDFDEYEKKHPAFAGLMKVSLYQESCCLIGYSVSDPNFIKWAEWVQDLAPQDKDMNKEDSINLAPKIYFISMEALCDTDTLFLQNRNIEIVDIRELKEKKSNGITVKSQQNSELASMDKSVCMAEFLNKLENNEKALENIANSTKGLSIEIYQKINANLRKKLTPQTIKEIYKEIKILYTQEMYFIQDLLFQLLNTIMQFMLEQKIDVWELWHFDMLALLLKINYLTLNDLVLIENINVEYISNLKSSFLDKKFILNTKEQEQQYLRVIKAIIASTNILEDSEYKKLETHIKSLTFKKIKNDLNDDLLYQKALLLAVHFREVEYHNVLLEEWKFENNTSIEYYIKKASLLIFFNRDEAIDLVLKAKDILLSDQLCNISNVDKIIYTQIILYFFDITYLSDKNKYKADYNTLKNIVDTYKNNGGQTLSDILDAFMPKENKTIETAKKKIFSKTQKGYARFPLESKERLSSIQLPQFFSMHGIPFAAPVISMPHQGWWCNFFDKHYIHNYHMLLFLSCKYLRDMEFSIIQRNINRVFANKQIPVKYKEVLFDKVCSNISQMIKQDFSIRQAIYMIAEMSITIDSKKVNSFFVDFYNLVFSNDKYQRYQKSIFQDIPHGVYKAFLQIIRKVSDKTVLQNFFEECINITLKNTEGFFISTNYLDEILNKDITFDTTKSISKFINSITHIGTIEENKAKEFPDIDSMLNSISVSHDRTVLTKSIIYRLEIFSHYKLLKDQEDKVIEKIAPFVKTGNIKQSIGNLFYLARNFSDQKNKNELIIILKEKILKDDKILFDNGINGNHTSVPRYSGEIKQVFFEKEMWKTDISTIYNHAYESFKEISFDDGMDILFYRNWLNDIYWILKTYAEDLKNKKGYQNFKKDLQKLLASNEEQHNNNFIKIISEESADPDKLIDSINIIISKIFSYSEGDKDWKKIEKDLEMSWLVFIHRILFKKQPRLEECVKYLSSIIVEQYTTISWLQKYEKIYLEILEQYQHIQDNTEMEIIYIYEQFNTLAQFFKDKKIGSDSILDYWLKGYLAE